MSSHHVVRENQEPALLVQDFNAIDVESLGQILEWSPTIITDDDNLDFFLSEGIKVDVVFSNNINPFLQEQTKVLPTQGSFVEEALQYLIDNHYKAVNMLSPVLDITLSRYASAINIVLFYDTKRYVFVRSKFEKWKSVGELIYISDSYIKSFQGLDFIQAGVFRTQQDGFFQIEFNTDDYVVVGENI